MKKHHISKKHEEDRDFQATAVSIIGACYGFRGMMEFLDGYEMNDSDKAKEGLRMMFSGSGLSLFAPLIQDGSMTMEQLLNHLDHLDRQ